MKVIRLGHSLLLFLLARFLLRKSSLPLVLSGPPPSMWFLKQWECSRLFPLASPSSDCFFRRTASFFIQALPSFWRSLAETLFDTLTAPCSSPSLVFFPFLIAKVSLTDHIPPITMPVLKRKVFDFPLCISFFLQGFKFPPETSSIKKRPTFCFRFL